MGPLEVHTPLLSHFTVGVGDETMGPQAIWSVPQPLLIDIPNTTDDPLATLALVGETVSVKLQPPLAATE
jgi:hypothetical protein